MSRFEGKDKIYDELKGYFPPEYDLTPDELEKEIETENKKREIALGMIRPKAALSSTTEFSKLINAKPRNVKISASKRNIIEAEPAPSPIAEAAIASVAADTLPSDDDILSNLPILDSEDEAVESTDAIAEECAESISSAEEADELFDDSGNDDNMALDFENLFAKEEPEDIPDNIITISSAKEDAAEAEEPILSELFKEMENTEDEDSDWNEDHEKARKTVSWFFDFLEIFTVCITIIIVVFAFFARLTEVSGNSMVDTLHDKERLIVSNFMYEPKTGDIVVLQNTSIDNKTLSAPLVKRVIAVGGETVKISAEGIVTVTDKKGNDKVLEQPYAHFEVGESYRGAPMEVSVPEGYVFVMGDNRNYSADSRGELGLVDERCIFGKAIARVLPIDKFTFFQNPYEN